MLDSFHVSAVSSQSVLNIGDSHYNTRPRCWLGPLVRERGQTVAFGDIRATLYPQAGRQREGTHGSVGERQRFPLTGGRID